MTAGPAHAADAGEIPFNAQKILEFHNAERAARGIGPLSRDPRMDQHAQALAESLSARGVLEHSASVARTLGYPAGGQNLVFRAPTLNASEAHYMWMTSSNHRRNLLNPGFTHAGIGIACSRESGRAYPVAVVDFGGQGLSPEVPPQDPVTVPAGALQGHDIVCDGSAAPTAPAPQPAPPPPPAPAPAPAQVPVVAKPAAPKPAPAPPVAPPAAAPAAPDVPAAPPPAEEVLPEAALSPEEQPGAFELAQAAPVGATDPLAGWTAFVAGSLGALLLAGTAGGLWFRRRIAAFVTGSSGKSGKIGRK